MQRLAPVCALALCFVLAVPAVDAGVARRAIRIDGFGAWQELAIGTAGCPGTSIDSTLVHWQDFVFSGREDAAHLFDVYCQRPEPGTFTVNYGDELALGALIGENKDDRVTALRYSFLDEDRFGGEATGFQWLFMFFPHELTVVGLYGFENELLDARSYILRQQSGHGAPAPIRLWDGAEDGYDGQYFCFEQGRYIGTWDGTLADDSACSSKLQRIFHDRFESAP